ncbi:MAG: TlpA disulfide reductase family protein [Planctomycetota bacterium]
MTISFLTVLMMSSMILAAPLASDAGEPMTLEAAKAVMAKEMESRPAPFVGQKAPELKVAGWVQGGPVSGFASGEIYVVEMWATWCGPCIAVIPHLNTLHLQYQADKDHAVTFIGMNISDARPDETAEQRVERIERFIEDRDGAMTYAVAFEDGQLMGETWMEPAGQQGIPASFIVDGDGRIAWVGHPSVIDEPLEQIVNGDHDLEEAKVAQVGQVVMNEALNSIEGGGDVEAALRSLEAVTLTAFDNNPEMRAQIGYLVSQMEPAGETGRAWSLRIAQAAVELPGGQQALPVAMLGHVMEANGDFKGAAEHMKKAVDLNEDEQLEQFFQDEAARLEAMAG